MMNIPMMMKKLTKSSLMQKTLLTCFIAFAPLTVIFAAEPANLYIYKQALIQYHDSGQYQADIAQVVAQARAYLQQRLQQNNFGNRKPAIVLDIDETSLSNYNDLVRYDFGGTFGDIAAAEDQGKDPAIQPTLALFRFAKANHVAVFFVTGRYDTERKVTEMNLFQVGYQGWNGLILRTPNAYKVTAAAYKSAVREQLTQQGYDIILSLGDQSSDFQGGFVERGFKVPNP